MASGNRRLSTTSVDAPWTHEYRVTMRISDFVDRQVLACVAHVLRNGPTARGRWRLVRRYMPLMRQIGPTMGERIIRSRYGFKIGADLGDWIGQHLYLTGLFEPPTAHLMHELIGPGDTVVDVGANVGFFRFSPPPKWAAMARSLPLSPFHRCVRSCRRT